MLRSFGNNSLGLSTMIHAEWPRTVTAASTLHEKDRETGESQDVESQKGIMKTTRVEMSNSSRMDSQEDDILHP